MGMGGVGSKVKVKARQGRVQVGCVGSKSSLFDVEENDVVEVQGERVGGG